MFGDRPRILQIGPIPPPTDGGIAAYLDGLLHCGVADRVALETFDVRVPTWSQRIRPLRTWTSAQFLSGLAHRLDQTTPDLVHIHSSAYLSFWEKSAMGHLAARRGIPWVLHLHDGHFEPFLRNLRQPFAGWAKRTLQSASGVISVCRSWETWLRNWVPPQRLHCIPNALDVGRFDTQRQPTPTPHLLFIGDLSPAKGVWDLLDAVGRLRQRGVAFRVDLVGEAASAAMDRRLRRRLDTDDLVAVVRIHGRLYGAEKRQLMRRAALFVLPSHRESFCIANLEAMASGLPVVSTRTGAIPEVVRQGREGLLIEPGDRAALASALETLLQDPERRRRLGDAARRRAQEFDWAVVTDRLVGVYEGILHNAERELVSA